MTEQELLMQAATVPVMYFDGFGAFRKSNGVYRFVGYVHDAGPQLNVIMPISGADQSNHASRRALDEKVTRIQTLEGALVLSH